MIGIDTNVLLRLFEVDQPSQTAAARRLIKERGAQGIVAPALVIAELARVLRRTFKRSVEDVVRIIERILEAPEFIVLEADAVREALSTYREGASDFADCLIVVTSRRAGAEHVYTFDQAAAAAIPGARLLHS
jgi:predicted nucleic-acid-binding protein